MAAGGNGELLDVVLDFTAAEGEDEDVAGVVEVVDLCEGSEGEETEIWSGRFECFAVGAVTVDFTSGVWPAALPERGRWVVYHIWLRLIT